MLLLLFYIYDIFLPICFAIYYVLLIQRMKNSISANSIYGDAF